MEGQLITIDDFRSLCRGCLTDSKNNICCNLNDYLFVCASMQLSKEDKLPEQYCQQCSEDLTNCYKFVDKYQRAEKTLNAVACQMNSVTKTQKVELLSPEIKQQDILIEISDLEENNPSGERKPYKCGVCGKGFKEKRQRFVHEKRHTGEKPWTCDVCKKGFSEKSTLKVHSWTHSQEKPHKCRFCEKTFAKTSILVIHERTHTGERPFKCGFCEKGFRRKEDQVVHERIHTGEKPYICEVCNKAFTDKSGMRAHLWTHKCGFCEKTFVKTSERLNHERTHAQEKP